jgi:hypothetical protein
MENSKRKIRYLKRSLRGIREVRDKFEHVSTTRKKKNLEIGTVRKEDCRRVDSLELIEVKESFVVEEMGSTRWTDVTSGIEDEKSEKKGEDSLETRMKLGFRYF